MSPVLLLVISILLISILILTIKCISDSRRLKEIRRVINAMASGDFSSRMVLAPADKLGDVALQVNELSQGIKKRINELTEEKEKLVAILSGMAEGVVVISPQERLIHVSPSFLDMLEVRSTDWTNKYYWEIISNPTIHESIREAIAKRQVFRKDIQLDHPQERYFSMLISPVLDPLGKLSSLVAVFHDVTELKKFERLRSDFVANVSHELRTPLTSIKGFIETLKGGAIEDKVNAHHFLDIISKQTLRLESLVNDLLVLSSLESKEEKLQLNAYEVATIIQAVILMKKKQMQELEHHLILNVSLDLPKVKIDSSRMEQVFLNLIDNAVKFTPSKGTIEIKASVEGSFVRVDIIDSGPGISTENISRLFERFFRVDKARSEGGTGLGLSIVKHIMEAHQGKITVQSMLGQGSIFSVFLPIHVV